MKVLHSNQKQTIRYFAFIMLFMATLAMGCSNNEEFDSLNPESENLAEDLLTKANFDSDAFVTEWLVPKDSVVTLPIDTNKQYICIIDWGDDSELTKIFNKADYKRNHHRYSATGVYRIKILGDYPAWSWSQASNCKDYLTKIVQWGNVNIQDLSYGFSNCTNLASIPAGIPNLSGYTATFLGCIGLISLPDELFAKSRDATSFFATFSWCRNLKTLPPNLFKNCYKVKEFTETFYIAGLISLPDGLFHDCIDVETFNRTFMNCTNLISIPANLFYTCSEVTSMEGIFTKCRQLQSLPSSLFDHCKKITNFTSSFYRCSSLSGETPKTDTFELWDRAGKTGYPEIINGDGCFQGTKFVLSLIPKEWGGTLEK